MGIASFIWVSLIGGAILGVGLYGWDRLWEMRERNKKKK